MVYPFVAPLSPIVFYFYTVFFLLTNKYTFYFNYVTSLNFWDTNVLFILTILLSFVFFFLKFFVSIFSFLFFKISSFFQLIFFKSLIISLVIGTVTIHPLGFYAFTIAFLVKFFYGKRFYSLAPLNLSNSTLIYCLSLTLFLGSLWATQSSSWGYFWVNDLVEWSLLFFIIYAVVSVHNYSHKITHLSLFFIPLFFISFLIFLRFGFFSTRHNFMVLELTLYIVFFTYTIFFYVFSKNLKSKLCFNKFFFWISLLVFSLIYYCQLFVFKYFFFIMFTVFFSKKVSVYVSNLYAHILFFSVLLVWLIFFNFFSLNYTIGSTYNYTGFIFYNNFIFGQTYYLTSILTTQVVDIVNFLFCSLHKSANIFLSKLQILVVFNNLYLPYCVITVLYILCKIGWI